MDNLDWREPANDNRRACATCQGEVTGRTSKKYCGKACARIAERSKRDGVAEKARRNETAPDRECEYCGTTFRRHRDTKNAARFCSRACGFAAKSNAWQSAPVSDEMAAKAAQYAVTVRTTRCLCHQCGSRFEACDLSARFCSEECRTGAKRLAHWNKRGVDTSPRACPECAIVFDVSYGRGHAVYCSNECSKRRNARVGKTKRKALLRNVANDNIDPFKVFDRDGWRCKLCGVKTPRKLRGTYEDRAPELDHILPLSLGGAHTYENVQCACRSCNGAKGATPKGQMLLFG